jgi:DHA1 family bicyclomycin/chloramphenicol resistance-like MFS transporter
MAVPREAEAEPGVVWLDRGTPPHIVTLVLLAGVSALNLNIILPSLPGIAAHFDADYGVVALAISAYLGLTAVLQLFLGPLSDRFGRRPVILGCLAVFLVATVGCMLAPSVEAFLAFRLLQASVAAGIALSRAIVRDMVPAERAASMIGYVTMGMSLVPMIAPMIGGLLDQAFGWQSVFGFTLAFGLAALALIWADLGETNLAPSESLAAQFRAYPDLFRSRRFWGYSLTATLASGAFFAFLGGGPWVASELLGMSPSSLGLHFGFVAAGYMLGNFLSGRYAQAMGMNRMMLAGSIVSTVGIALAQGLFALGLATPLSFFAAIMVVGLGNGLMLPSANAGVVSVRPHLAGSASGLGPGRGAWPLLAIMFASSALSIVTTLDVIRTARRRGL